jgi:hypothetical protein
MIGKLLGLIAMKFTGSLKVKLVSGYVLIIIFFSIISISSNMIMINTMNKLDDIYLAP